MDTRTETKIRTEKQIMVEDVNRLLEIGRLLLSVLTSEEIEELQKLLSSKNATGNTGDS